jgi:hypothetical protein
MEIPRNVWLWLVKLKAVASVRASKTGSSSADLVKIDQQAQAELESGIALAKALGQLDRRSAKHLDSIKSTATSPVARLANWTLLEKTLRSSFNLALERNEKAMIVAGDTQLVLALYTKVYQASKSSRGGKGGGRNGNKNNKMMNNNRNGDAASTGFESVSVSNNKGGKGSKGGRGGNGTNGGGGGLPASDDDEIMSVRIGDMKVTKAQLEEVEKKPKGSLNSYTSATTFMLASMTQRLSIRPQQAAALLDTNRRYLTHILMHGIKSSYEPVLRWMQHISKNIEAFGAVLVRDIKTAPVDKMRRGMRSIEQGTFIVVVSDIVSGVC